MISQSFLWLYVFIIGTALGSFLNVLAYRVPLNRSILGRSFCENCHQHISWYDLFPIVSYLRLKGQCRFCSKRISLIHPIFELVTGILVLVWFVKISWVFSVASLLILLIMLLALTLAMADYYYQVIPDQFLLVLLSISFFYNYHSLPGLLMSACLACFVFWLLHFFSKGAAMGYGDVKYVFVLGFILPWSSLLLAIYLAFLTGGIVSAILILSKRKEMKSVISFGPFLSFGLIISLLVLI